MLPLGLPEGTRFQDAGVRSSADDVIKVSLYLSSPSSRAVTGAELPGLAQSSRRDVLNDSPIVGATMGSFLGGLLVEALLVPSAGCLG
ncbi:hypothetical protein RRG08_033069 [Elysia crispata]|uniref:Uncharacterized protein n=1 Tax=Elysia crispata TaxID=231223 RepID=A0AAE1DUV8_9GAST|nr:hypothetical protein RRG08_033069 [Elysia crispata]